MAGLSGVNRRRRALLSVTDKSDLADIAVLLHSYDYELIASGGTAAYLRGHGFEVTDVSQVTGFPEIFGGRIKTLHPAIHGGILGPTLADFATVSELGVQPIDVVCVNLYRFEQAVREGSAAEVVVEQIDIGGPALLRAAAKNFARVTVLSDPDQYEEFLHELRAHDGGTSRQFRQRMAAAAFSRVTAYDRAIAEWLAEEGHTLTSGRTPLRYGENPHQRAHLLIVAGQDGGNDLPSCGLRQMSGKELSYNNLVDLIAALKLVGDFETPCCGVIKHTNPCGFAVGEAAAALPRALLCDPVSAFGGVFAFNTPIDMPAAELLAGRFLEIVAAPAFSLEALARLRKKKNVRLLTCDAARFRAATAGRSRGFGRVILEQDEDFGFSELESWQIVAGPEPSEAMTSALVTVWKVCKHGKSNAIVIGDAAGTLGIGVGQMSRVDSVRLAIRKASDQNLDLRGAVAASDGFFPFADGIEHLARAGVQAVISPRGSLRDAEVAAAADELGITLVFAERRHFSH